MSSNIFVASMSRCFFAVEMRQHLESIKFRPRPRTRPNLPPTSRRPPFSQKVGHGWESSGGCWNQVRRRRRPQGRSAYTTRSSMNCYVIATAPSTRRYFDAFFSIIEKLTWLRPQLSHCPNRWGEARSSVVWSILDRRSNDVDVMRSEARSVKSLTIFPSNLSLRRLPHAHFRSLKFWSTRFTAVLTTRQNDGGIHIRICGRGTGGTVS